jgi:hypothetical protein
MKLGRALPETVITHILIIHTPSSIFCRVSCNSCNPCFCAPTRPPSLFDGIMYPHMPLQLIRPREPLPAAWIHTSKRSFTRIYHTRQSLRQTHASINSRVRICLVRFEASTNPLERIVSHPPQYPPIGNVLTYHNADI